MQAVPPVLVPLSFCHFPREWKSTLCSNPHTFLHGGNGGHGRFGEASGPHGQAPAASQLGIDLLPPASLDRCCSS